MSTVEQNTDKYKIVAIESNMFDLIDPDIDYMICSGSIIKGFNNEISDTIRTPLNGKGLPTT